MRKTGWLLLLVLLGFSCKKEDHSSKTLQTHGTLYYSDPAVDGAGLFFTTDQSENILFKNEDADYYAQYLHYKDFVGSHCRLTYEDEGAKGCPPSMDPGYCQTHGWRIVKVKKIEKD